MGNFTLHFRIESMLSPWFKLWKQQKLPVGPPGAEETNNNSDDIKV